MDEQVVGYRCTRASLAGVGRCRRILARPTAGRRLIAGVVAVILLAMWAISADLVVEEALLPDLWPWLWGVTSATCIVAAIRPASIDAWIVSGAALLAVCVGRVAALWARVPDDLATAGQAAVSADRAALGSAVYALLVWLIVCTWVLAAPRRRP